MKKLLILLLMVGLTWNALAEEDVSDYFYKQSDNLFQFLPESDNPQEETISLGYWGYDAIITKIIRNWSQYGLMTSRLIYAYQFVGNSVVSNAQSYDLITGKTIRKDKLTILTLPTEKGSWVEYQYDERYDCKSEWVYVSFVTNGGEQIVDKAIKISKSCNQSLTKQLVTTYTYWTKGYGYIAAYNRNNTTKQVSVGELKSFISSSKRIKEVSEKEYAEYLLIKEQKEKAKKQAELEAKYQKFVQNLKPQLLGVVNSEASKAIKGLFNTLEEERYISKVYNGVTSLNEKTQLSFYSVPESEWNLSVPEEDQDTIESLISKLYGEGKIKEAYATEPTTSKNIALEQYMDISIDVSIQSESFDVVRKKKSWQLADKNLAMPDEYAKFICKAAQSEFEKNRKAKKQTVELRMLFWNNKLEKIWNVRSVENAPTKQYLSMEIDPNDTIYQLMAIQDASRNWSLNGRKLVGGLPKPVGDFTQEGKVVVFITVNKEGYVVSARAGQGTTISDEATRQIAVKAAMRARFNAVDHPNATMGTITYYFKFR